MGKCLNFFYFHFKSWLLLLALMCFFSIKPLVAQKKVQIRIIHADVLESAKVNGKKAQKLVGNVSFSHQDAIMYCDSAFMYSGENAIDAYGHIRIQQGDSMNLYGDILHYDGNKRLATVLGKKVQLIKSDMTLTTTKLIYNRFDNTATYSNGATIEMKSDGSTLISKKGFYQSDKNQFTFKDSVVLTNKDFVMRADTLLYNSVTKWVDFVGPTTIESDSNFIYCEDGWYDMPKEVSSYYKNAYLISDGKKLKGDTLFYNRKERFGRAIQHVELTDTAENIVINGGIALVYELKDSAVIYDKPMLSQILEGDSLFMHADTFKIYGEEKSRHLFAYYGVRIYKSDLQGSCDSLAYAFSDSTLKLRGTPVLWSEENQLTANKIDIRTKDNKINSIFMDGDAFIISEVDSIRYNQIKGKKMYGYFKDSKLHKIEVRGNGQTTYYGLDDDKKYIGVNVAVSSNIDITMKDQEINSILFIEKPVASMHPIGSLDPILDLRYPGFQWLIDLRPKNKEDIFRKIEPSEKIETIISN